MRKRLPPVALLLLAAGLAGVMTVDKPPLALWIQVASVEVFGFQPLAMLIPQALMGSRRPA